MGQAAPLLRECCRLHQEPLGVDHERTLAIEAILCIDLGQAPETVAEGPQRLRSTLDTQRRVCGAQSLATLATAKKLAYLLAGSGALGEAREILLASEAAERLLGFGDEDLLLQATSTAVAELDAARGEPRDFARQDDPAGFPVVLPFRPQLRGLGAVGRAPSATLGWPSWESQVDAPPAARCDPPLHYHCRLCFPWLSCPTLEELVAHCAIMHHFLFIPSQYQLASLGSRS